MVKLTSDQIKFIDDFLYNAGVYYIDIRYEMTDHIATAIENMDGDFAQNFFAYMAANKRELLAGNKKFKSGAMSKALSNLWYNYKKPGFLLAIAVLTLLSVLLTKYVGYNEVFGYYMFGHIIIYAAFYVAWVYFWTVKRNRYSVVDRLLLVGWFVPMFFRFSDRFTNEITAVIFMSLYSSLIIALLMTIVSVHKKYKLYYNG